MAAVLVPSTTSRLCHVLSGFDDLSERFVTAAIADLREGHGDAAVDMALAVFDADGIDAFLGDPAFASTARTLLTFLYTGFSERVDAVTTDSANHFESLMWRAAMAHPPALSGGYFGHWAYPPEAALP